MAPRVMRMDWAQDLGGGEASSRRLESLRNERKRLSTMGSSSVRWKEGFTTTRNMKLHFIAN